MLNDADIILNGLESIITTAKNGAKDLKTHYEIGANV